MRRHFTNVRSLFSNVRSLLTLLKCLLILVPGLGNSRKVPFYSGKGSFYVAPDCSPDEISTCAYIRPRVYIVAIPTFYVSYMSHLSLVGTILLGQMGQVGHLFLA